MRADLGRLPNSREKWTVRIRTILSDSDVPTAPSVRGESFQRTGSNYTEKILNNFEKKFLIHPALLVKGVLPFPSISKIRTAKTNEKAN